VSAQPEPRPSGWVLTIVGPDTMPGVGGFDSMLLPVPARWYGEMRDGSGRVLLGPIVGKELRELSETGAGGVGEQLHHADWVITSDPAQVEQIGMTHDCAYCRAGTDKALAWLADHPGGEIAAGLLYWRADL
jgi:hypothetical protein